jgi:uncharacterized membrane protein YdjX (TVP38/TMEM64 family)
MASLKRTLPLIAIVVLLAAALAFGAPELLTWDKLAEQQAALLALVAQRPLAAALGYVAVYALCVAVSLPGAVVITVAGGLLFGTPAGAALAVCGASIGAVLVFLAARGALAPLLAARAGPFLERVRPGLERDGFSYVLALRLVPVVPFWLVNLAPALVGMRLLPYAAATFIGIIPATTVFAAIGAGIGAVLARGERPDLSVILSAPVLLPLLALAALSLLPVAWRALKGRDAKGPDAKRPDVRGRDA